MPVKAIAKTSIARNGVGAYVRPCHRVTVNYCNWGGSSNGLRTMLKSGELNSLATKNSAVYFDVVKRSGHPSFTFHYNNDVVKDISIANLSTKEIVEKFEEYSQRAGGELFKMNQKVVSINDSVRGIWSPLHTPKTHRHKI